MQNVRISFTQGPMSGQAQTFEVGKLLVGRQPGDGGLELKNADKSVSRQHAELREAEGGVELNNLSPNGTQVNGKTIVDTQRLQPGDEIAMGDSHVFNVHWESFIAAPDPDSDDDSAETLTPGPLASPAVRAVLVVYLLAMVGLAVWLMGSDAGNATSPDDWPALKEAYEEYQVEHVPEEERADRMERAALLLRRVRAMTTQGLYYQMIPVCRDIMAVDGDIQSPLFEYGAQCLATANVEGYE